MNLATIKGLATDGAGWQRAAVLGVLVLGSLLSSGGVIPETDMTISFLSSPTLQKVGQGLLGLAALFVTKWPEATPPTG